MAGVDEHDNIEVPDKVFHRFAQYYIGSDDDVFNLGLNLKHVNVATGRTQQTFTRPMIQQYLASTAPGTNRIVPVCCSILVAWRRSGKQKHNWRLLKEALHDVGLHEAIDALYAWINGKEFDPRNVTHNQVVLSDIPADVSDGPEAASASISPGWYENTGNPGLMLIINNEKFENPQSNRAGTNKDAERLRKTFESLGFKVEVKKDCRAEEMESNFETFARKQSKEYSGMIVAVLSHGHNGIIAGTDGGSVDIEKSLHLFNAQRCSALQEKPKFFIFQNCRGRNHDHGSVVTDSSPSTWLSDLFESRIKPDGPGDHIPSMSDFIVAYSTGQGYFSLRDEVNGSWFIQTLCDVFDQHAHNGEEIGMLLRMVNNQMAARAPEQPEGSVTKVTQMPEICDRLTKQWKLSSK